MNTMSHYYATERSRRRHDRNAKYRALAWVREEREREQRARTRGLVRDRFGRRAIRATVAKSCTRRR
jgi:hypothetical protein